jgi:hypothetical protein
MIRAAAMAACETLTLPAPRVDWKATHVPGRASPMSDAARELARALQDLDRLVNTTVITPAGAWAELRMIRADAMRAFEALTGKSVGEAIERE